MKYQVKDEESAEIAIEIIADLEATDKPRAS
jgi:hypothetical protein